MKLLNLALISACALISTVRSDSFITALYSSALYIVNNYYEEDLYGGFVLGLQYDNTDTTTDCYTSYGDVYADASTLPTWIADLVTNSAGGNEVAYQMTDNPYYMPGLYFKAAKRLSETGNLFFVMYE
jgi:hypothetical protein